MATRKPYDRKRLDREGDFAVEEILRYHRLRRQRQHEAAVAKLVQRAKQLPKITDEEDRECEESYRRTVTALARVFEAERESETFHKVVVGIPVKEIVESDDSPHIDVEMTLDGELKGRPFDLVIRFRDDIPSASAQFTEVESSWVETSVRRIPRRGRERTGVIPIVQIKRGGSR